MSLTDKEWLSAIDLAKVTGWSVTKARTVLWCGRTFSQTQTFSDSAGRQHIRVHRDEVVDFVNNKMGGRHGRN